MRYRRAVSAWGVIVLYGPDAFALCVGLPDDNEPHPRPGVRTIYLDPFGDWEPEDLGYLYDRGLVLGAAHRVVAIVVNYWDSLDRKREMPIIPAAKEVDYRDDDGHTWDLAIRVPRRFDPSSYEWGCQPAMASFWPGASLLWPVCERGQLSAVYPWGRNRPLTRARPGESFGTQTGRCRGPWAVGPGKSTGLMWSSSTGRVASQRGVWFDSSPMGRHSATWGCMRQGSPTTAG